MPGVRLWSVEPGVTANNPGPSRTPSKQLMGRLASSTDGPPVAYNDEVTARRTCGFGGPAARHRGRRPLSTPPSRLCP
jgi:hypothetical protein